MNHTTTQEGAMVTTTMHEEQGRFSSEGLALAWAADLGDAYHVHPATDGDPQYPTRQWVLCREVAA